MSSSGKRALSIGLVVLGMGQGVLAWGQESEPAPPSETPAEAQAETPLETPTQAVSGKDLGDQGDSLSAPAADPLDWFDSLVQQSKGRLVVAPKGPQGSAPKPVLATLLPLDSTSAADSNAAAPGIDDLPALVLCGDTPSHRSFLGELVQPSSDEIRELAASLVVFFVPQIRASHIDAAGIRFAADFPIGWLPSSLRQGAGDVPFSRADSVLMRELLGEHPNIVVLLLDGVAAPLASMGSLGPQSDAELTQGAGGLAAFAWQTYGVATLGLGTKVDAAGVRSVLTGLPKLKGTVLAVEQLDAGQWRVDLELRNSGRWPTYSKLGQSRFGARGLSLEVTGGRVLAAAADPGTGTYSLVEGRDWEEGWRLAMAPLEGLGTRNLRLIVEGAQAELLVTLSSAWIQKLSLRIPLE